jgi:hypothetical protein
MIKIEMHNPSIWDEVIVNDVNLGDLVKAIALMLIEVYWISIMLGEIQEHNWDRVITMLLPLLWCCGLPEISNSILILGFFKALGYSIFKMAHVQLMMLAMTKSMHYSSAIGLFILGIAYKADYQKNLRTMRSKKISYNK